MEANYGTSKSSRKRKENKMAYVPLYMNKVNGWEKVHTSVNANPNDLAHLLNHNGELGTKAARMRALSAEQAVITARKQSINAEMQEIMRDGQTLLDYIQTGVRQHYGLRSEKLVEFGLRPIRAKALPPSTEPPPTLPETVAPETAPAPDTAK
jgi:hypothetical protein